MRFSNMHPITVFIQFVFVLFITMFTQNPIILGISLVFSLICILMLENYKFFKSFFYYAIFIIVVMLINPLFVQGGETTLFNIGSFKFTLEAMLSGFMFALLIVCVVIWFSAYNQAFGNDKTLFLFSKTLPNIALVLTLSVRLVPRYLGILKEVKLARKLSGQPAAKGLVNKIKMHGQIFITLLTIALEQSMDTANSMRGRGYGLKGKTLLNVYKFRLSDFVVIFFQLALFAVALSGFILGIVDCNFLPSITMPQLTLFTAVVYISIVALMSMPLLIEIFGGSKYVA